MPTFEAEVHRAVLPEQQDLADHREHCSADDRALSSIGRAQGQQVRVRPAADPARFAICTVSEVRSENPLGVVRMARDGRARLGLTGEFAAVIDSAVPAPGLSPAQARQRGEFIEQVSDNGTHDRLIAIAPHGGQIEPHTDAQADRVARQLSEYGVSSWRCLGFTRPGAESPTDASDRLHITSGDIHEASFPGLASVIGRGFRYAVSFHGFRRDEILVGGAAPFLLKAEVARSIEIALGGSGVDVRIALPDDAFGGSSPRNIVNRLTADGRSGIQIEQGPAIRKSHAADIADAVAEVFAVRLDPPGGRYE